MFREVSMSTHRSYRIERDSMGEVHVPNDALYGAQTQRAVDNFQVSGLRMPRAFIRALGLVKACAAEANARLRQIDAPVAEAIVAAAARVASGELDAHFPVDVFQTGSGTSSNMNANEVIARLASETLGRSVHPNDEVNLAQSSNDMIPTAIHVSARLQCEEQLLPALQRLTAHIERRAGELERVVKTGRTHLMDALPITFGQELGGWRAQIEDDLQRLRESLSRLERVAAGGTAVGTGVNAHPQFAEQFCDALRRATGLGFRPHSNRFAAISGQQGAVELSGQLRGLAVTLMKISNDLRWMNSGPLSGLAEIALPPLQPGSSIMPGKVNPVIPEAVAMVCAQVIGNDATIAIAGQSGSFQLNTMLPLVAYDLLQSVELLANAADLLGDKVVAGFSVNSERLRAQLDRNPVLATALNPILGYDRSAEIAKRAYAQQRPVLEVAERMTDVSSEKLATLLDPVRLAIPDE
jgi:fumarate hydratase class II